MKLESRSKFHLAYAKIKSCSCYSKMITGSIIHIGNAPNVYSEFKIIKIVKNSTVTGLDSAIVPHLVIHVVPYFNSEAEYSTENSYEKDSEYLFYEKFNKKLRKIPFIKMLSYYSFLRKNIIGYLKLDHDFRDIDIPVIKLEFFANVLNDCFYDELDMFEFAVSYPPLGCYFCDLIML